MQTDANYISVRRQIKSFYRMNAACDVIISGCRSRRRLAQSVVRPKFPSTNRLPNRYWNEMPTKAAGCGYDVVWEQHFGQDFGSASRTRVHAAHCGFINFVTNRLSRVVRTLIL